MRPIDYGGFMTDLIHLSMADLTSKSATFKPRRICRNLPKSRFRSKFERRGRDSNPRDPCGPCGFQDRPIKSAKVILGKGLRREASDPGAQGKRGTDDVPADLAEVIAAWPRLSEGERMQILIKIRCGLAL